MSEQRTCWACRKSVKPDPDRRGGWITDDGLQFCPHYTVGVYEHTPANVVTISTTASEQEHVFLLLLDPGFALEVTVNGRKYVGVTMPDEDHPVEVVYWPNEDGDDNVTVTPPGIPTYPADPSEKS